MTARIANIWRHPLKGHSRESLTTTLLSAGKTMPGDRAWAVTHAASRADVDDPAWLPPANFSRGSKNGNLMAIDGAYNDATRTLNLTHPDRPDISFDPDNKADVWRFLDWLEPLNIPGKLEPTGIISVPERGMTDTDFPSISILSLPSLADFSAKAGQEINAKRFRGNFWLEGLAPWQEFDLIGQEIQLGNARVRILERTVRCMATTANTDTGQRDLDTLGLLKDNWGHTDFGVYAEVIEGGPVSIGDTVTLGNT
ncbi:MAG: hypothetical protein ACI861_001747 [Paracoccaceae bacterium]|jgi:uncharacterized protein YcbX